MNSAECIKTPLSKIQSTTPPLSVTAVLNHLAGYIPQQHHKSRLNGRTVTLDRIILAVPYKVDYECTYIYTEWQGSRKLTAQINLM